MSNSNTTLRRSNAALLFACFVSILVTGLLAGCSRLRGPAQPDGMFPETVGRYKLKNVEDGRNVDYENAKNKGQSYQSWRSTYSDGTNNIYYEVGMHKSAEAAANELGSLTRCFDSNRKLMTGNKVWDGIPIKDASGKVTGKMAVCFSNTAESNRTLGNEGFGDYAYTFSISQDTRSYTVKPLKENMPLVAEFVKALPSNSGTDLSTVDALARAKTAKQPSYRELFDAVTPEKLAAKPYLKNRVLVLERDATNSQSTSVTNSTGYFIDDMNRHALLAEDIGSIVRVDCKRSRRVGTYTAGEGDAIPTYGSTCEVKIIDNTSHAVIAKKIFTNEDMADVQLVDANRNGKVSFKEYVLPKPIGEVKDFVKALPVN